MRLATHEASYRHLAAPVASQGVPPTAAISVPLRGTHEYSRVVRYVPGRLGTPGQVREAEAARVGVTLVAHGARERPIASGGGTYECLGRRPRDETIARVVSLSFSDSHRARGASGCGPTHARVNESLSPDSHPAPMLNSMEPQEERIGDSTLNERILGRGWELIQSIEVAYESGDIDAAEWHARIGDIIGPAHLAAANPRAQSGYSGSADDWERARRFIFTAVIRDGTFLDVGCANGHLMECSVTWLAEAGFSIEPYGLEILPELAALARQRLPHWAERIAIGNALDWTPVRPFDFVRTGLEYVPVRLGAQLVAHLLELVVAPGGRLIIGAHSEAATSQPRLQAEVATWGFSIAGVVQVPHAGDHRVIRRAFWLEKAS